jgi:ketosteroid isomerase-like protein
MTMLSRNKSSKIKMAVISIIFIYLSPVSFAQVTTSDPSILIRVDKSFSDFSLKNGFANAFMAYADDNVIKLTSNSYPIIGKKDLVSQFSKIAISNHNVLTWTPLKAEIAQSGDLGYTFGNYQFRVKLTADKDTIYYGNYVSIWKKQKDGNWKYVLDGGNATPSP